MDKATLSESVCQPASQPASQSVSQSVSQSISQSVSEVVRHSGSQSFYLALSLVSLWTYSRAATSPANLYIGRQKPFTNGLTIIQGVTVVTSVSWSLYLYRYIAKWWLFVASELVPDGLPRSFTITVRSRLICSFIDSPPVGLVQHVNHVGLSTSH